MNEQVAQLIASYRRDAEIARRQAQLVHGVRAADDLPVDYSTRLELADALADLNRSLSRLVAANLKFEASLRETGALQ